MSQYSSYLAKKKKKKIDFEPKNVSKISVIRELVSKGRLKAKGREAFFKKNGQIETWWQAERCLHMMKSTWRGSP